MTLLTVLSLAALASALESVLDRLNFAASSWTGLTFRDFRLKLPVLVKGLRSSLDMKESSAESFRCEDSDETLISAHGPGGSFILTQHPEHILKVKFPKFTSPT